MNKVELKTGIYWVGGIDWDIRDFHGYSIRRGTSYNAYLIIDEKIVLVDTVKHFLFDEMVSRIKEIIDPSKIDIIISNHVEMDHSGSLPKILELSPNAEVITSVAGEKGLKRHYKQDLNLKVVQSGEQINLGKRNLVFTHIPMVHWPDSMVTYIPEEKLLLSNDAFGQHIASYERFDDEIKWDILWEESAKYYANIVMPYGDQAKRAVDALAGLDIDMIAPGHGVIWRSMIQKIMGEYVKWTTYQTESKVLIVYDSMWGSTEKMAYKLAEGLEEAGGHSTMRNLKTIHISDIIADLMTSKMILLGSATLNHGMLATMGGFLTYLKGLKPRNRIGFAFGSYGWSGEAPKEIAKVMEEMKWEIPEEPLKINYIPDDDDLVDVKEIGKRLGEHLKES